MQKDLERSSRSSGGGRQSGRSRSPKRSSRSGRSPTRPSRRHSEDQTTFNNATTKPKRRSSTGKSSKSPNRRSTSTGGSPKSPTRRSSKSRHRHSSGGEQKEKKTRSSSADNVRQLEYSPGGGDTPVLPFVSPEEIGTKRSVSPKSPRRSTNSPKRQSGGRPSHRRRSSGQSKSSMPASTLSTAVAIGTTPNGEQAFMAETVDEQIDESNRERMLDLEVQNDEIQQQMQNLTKNKKGKKGDMGQEAADKAGRRMTICKVLGIAAVYLAGVGTGFLLSELRRKKSSPAKEIYITQSPSAVVPTNPSTAPTEFSYDNPTEEDCFAIESKEEVKGQDGMISRSYDVHFDVQLNDSSTDWYGQLEKGLTDDVVPDLACCKMAPTDQRRGLVMEESPPPMEHSIRGRTRMLRNVRCVVGNGSARGEQNNDNGNSCVELTGGFCLPAVVTLDLVLKGDEPDADIIDLVRNVIQGDDSEPLVEKFDLESNVFSVVKLVDVVDHVPTQAPAILSYPTTSRPTISPTATSGPVVGPTTNAPTRVATQPPITRPATPKPTSSVTLPPITSPPTTAPPTIAPAPGVTPIPTPGPSVQPTSEPSPEPTESPSFSPTLVPTLLASSSPTSSPTTSAPTLTPSVAPTGRREVLEGILTPLVGTIYTPALGWLADTDTWSPPATEADPVSIWLERYAMVNFYLATNGASWTSQGGWMTSTSVCDWAPETCNGQNRVKQIKFGSNGLSGTIPTELGLLPNLDFFDLSTGAIRGTLPTEIGHLSNLKHFHIRSNDISGTIPSELGLLTAMTRLELQKCDLTGSIPPEVLSLSNLKWFSMHDNRLTGSIGSEVGAMREILELEFYRNDNLSGPLPSELGLLTKLTIIHFWKCGITKIPSELGLIATLQKLHLSTNNLTGTIPTALAQLTKLTSLILGHNNYIGAVPTELGLMTALINLDISSNNLSGTIPSEINLLTNLRTLVIDKTDVTGSIPDLSALVNLDKLLLDGCNLSGSIPPGMFDSMLHLEEIYLSENNLTGAIPAIPNPSLLTKCFYGDNCFSDVTNAGSCDLTNNCV